jgi:CRISPR-associated RAMP protein (TIGR02581 family)
MTEAATLDLRLRRRVRLDAQLEFQTGWRIGSGGEGETMSDLGIVLDSASLPLLPGSSLKGKLRNTCEALAHALGLSACLLNFDASGKRCPSDVKLFSRELREQHKAAIKGGLTAQLRWIEENTCDVCKLFGSPVRAARLKLSDGRLENPEAVLVQVRDGVVLDRDSHTAVDGLKYDYEVAPAGARFRFRLDLENPTDADLALLGAALFEWLDGSSLGGFTSRGLGRFQLLESTVRLDEVNLDDPSHRVRYLANADPEKRWQKVEDWKDFFQRPIKAILARPTPPGK